MAYGTSSSVGTDTVIEKQTVKNIFELGDDSYLDEHYKLLN